MEENIHLVQQFCSDIEIIPISIILPEYARQKAFLRRQGTLIDDLDLFIGTTATALEYIMVIFKVTLTAHTPNIRIENWIKP